MLYPKKLKKEPLIEVIWQVQFENEKISNVGDILVGILFEKINKQFPGAQVKRLMAAEIPSAIRQIDATLKYVPKYAIQDFDNPFIWQVGDNIVTLNCRVPYVGWSVFKDRIITLINFIKDSNLIKSPYKHSLRYIDFLDQSIFPDLSCLKLNIQIGEIKIHDKIQIKIDLEKGESLYVIQIATNMQINLSNQLKNGIIIDTDTYPIKLPESWENLEGQLDMLHDNCKSLFFEGILTKETIVKLDPEY